MKTITSILFGLLTASSLSVPAPVAQAQDYTISYVGDDPKEISTTYVSANAIRKKTPDVGAGELDVIDRVDRGIVIFLDHGTKTYRENTTQEIKQHLDAMSNQMNAEMNARMRDPQARERLRRMGVTQESTVEKLGPGGTIAGYPTEHYVLKGPMAQAELWITQSLQLPAAYYRDFNILSGVSTPFGKWDKIADLHGVILKRVVVMRGGARLSETATSVDKAAIPASVFEPPAGYRKVASRGVGEN